MEWSNFESHQTRSLRNRKRINVAAAVTALSR